MGKEVIFVFVALFLVAFATGYINYDWIVKDEWLDATLSLNQSEESLIIGNITTENINATGNITADNFFGNIAAKFVEDVWVNASGDDVTGPLNMSVDNAYAWTNGASITSTSGGDLIYQLG